MSPQQKVEVNIREATPADAAACGQICFDAFAAINAKHGFPSDFPSAEAAIGMCAMMFAHPEVYCVVAEEAGRIVGSNCLDERSVIAGVGPITVDPKAQNAGIGRKLMKTVMDRAEEKGSVGIRLVQAAFHTRSLSLYASLGFDVKEPLVCVQGKTAARNMPGYSVRKAQATDLYPCIEMGKRVHGFDRGLDVAQAIQHGTAVVVERGGRTTGYASDLAFFGHLAAETNEDAQALMTSVEAFGGPGILVPSRNTELLRWCLANGLRVVQPMTLMSKGLYNEPAGAWCPSVLF